MPETDSYTIRPAGRHILTIGRDLIQDPYAAVIELVKNAYDADSPDVTISFEPSEDGGHRIAVSDHGHGMSRDTVINKWMVPSTSDKEDRGGRSPSGRTMQGRKGIGRYAASVLGRISCSRQRHARAKGPPCTSSGETSKTPTISAMWTSS